MTTGEAIEYSDLAVWIASRCDPKLDEAFKTLVAAARRWEWVKKNCVSEKITGLGERYFSFTDKPIFGESIESAIDAEIAKEGV